MNRRELLKMIALVTGTAVVGGEIFLTACDTAKEEGAEGFSENDIAFLDEIAETILPRTSTPGAKDAAVGSFMTVMVTDCYRKEDQQVFREGMKALDRLAKQKYGAGFIELSAEDKTELLIYIEKEAKVFQTEVDEFNQQQWEKEQEEFGKGNLAFVREYKSSHYFIMMKQLTLLGFFTSEVGSTQALRHVAVPGRFEGCVPYNKGDRAWG